MEPDGGNHACPMTTDASVSTNPDSPLSPAARLLVVDDEEPNRDMLSRRLQRAGYAVNVAANGPEALQAIQSAEYDLILLDQMMPGMTGLDLLRLLRATNDTAELPVIMVTALSDSQQVVASLDAGANDYITKPVDFPVALARIQRHLQQSLATRGLRAATDRYELAAQTSGNCIFDWDLRSDLCHFAGPWATAIGLQGIEAARGALWLSLIDPADLPAMREALRGLREGTTRKLQIDHRLLLPNGEVRWIQAKGNIVNDNAGYPWRLVGAATNITHDRTHDPESQLPNALWLEYAIRQWLSRHGSPASDATPAPTGLAVLGLDFSPLRLWRSCFGPHLPPSILEQIQSRFAANYCSAPGTECRLVRLSTYQFAVSANGVPSLDFATQGAQHMLDTMKAPLLWEGQSIPMAPCGGLVWLNPQENTSAGEALHQIHVAMDAARLQQESAGQPTLCVYDPSLERSSLLRIESAQELRRAIDAREFELWYQPKFRLADLRLEGFEALARWRHPAKGLLGPYSFIPLAESTGLIVDLGRLVLQQACQQFADWCQRWPQARQLRISVNVSPAQLLSSDFVSDVSQSLDTYHLPASSLSLEVTESAMVEQIDVSRQKLETIQQLGVGLELDDFGTGYASLQHLRSLPFETLKIDQAFLRGPKADPGLFQSIMGIANTLGLHSIAEGVESQEHLEFLRRLGCASGQGYFFSRPLPANEAALFLADHLPAL